jgi:hypothetical protein
MPVHVSRKRKGVWYARGTVRVGKTRVIVAEYSTGCRARADAEAQAAARDAETRADLLHGGTGRPARLTIAECILLYLHRSHVPDYDAGRLNDFNERIGHYALTETEAGWAAWLEQRGEALAPASIKRCRAILNAALVYGARQRQAAAPELPPPPRVAGENDRIAFLTEAEADRLVAAYNRWAQPIAVVFRYQGLRTQEALRLDWRVVDWKRRTVFIAGTAAIGEARTKPRRARVADAPPCPGRALPVMAPAGTTSDRAGVSFGARPSVRRHARIRRQSPQTGACDGLPKGRDRGLPRARLEASLGFVDGDDRMRPRDAATAGRLVVAGDGAALRPGVDRSHGGGHRPRRITGSPSNKFDGSPSPAQRASDLMSAAELCAFAERILCVVDDNTDCLLLWEDLLHRAAHYLVLAERKEAEVAGFIAAGRVAATPTSHG